MARKAFQDLSPAYKRRIEAALAKGKTRQQARGHRAQEHVYRKQAEIIREGLTKDQQRIVFLWSAKRIQEIKESDLDPLDVVQWYKVKGYDAFKKYRAIWEQARRKYLRDARNKRYESMGMGHLINMHTLSQAKLEKKPDEYSWLYYH